MPAHAKTLTITQIKYHYGYADLTVCEVTDATGFRDGFEDMRLTYDSLSSDEEKRTDIDTQLRTIAANRRLDY